MYQLPNHIKNVAFFSCFQKNLIMASSFQAVVPYVRCNFNLKVLFIIYDVISCMHYTCVLDNVCLGKKYNM